MLRSLFSLIQRIVDTSDKQYNNTKSRAVIHCLTNPTELVNKQLEIIEQQRKMQEQRTIERDGHRFTIESQHGDVVTCRHNKKDVKILPNNSKSDTKRLSIENDERIDNVDAEVQPNVRELMKEYPRKLADQNKSDQISLLCEQIQKMKSGLERLHNIALQFNKSDDFTEDVNYLINNIRPHFWQQKKHDAKLDDLSSEAK